MSDIDTIMEQYQNRAKALTEANTLNKVAVFDALANAGITSVTVTFNGGGDSGQIEDIRADAGDKAVALPDIQIEIQHALWEGKLDRVETPFREAIEQLCFDCLSQEHCGWENNDGGSGDFLFHVEDRRIELDFCQFFTDSTQHLHTF